MGATYDEGDNASPQPTSDLQRGLRGAGLFVLWRLRYAVELAFLSVETASIRRFALRQTALRQGLRQALQQSGSITIKTEATIVGVSQQTGLNAGLQAAFIGE